MIEVKFTCETPAELKRLLALLAEDNVEAASSYEIHEKFLHTPERVRVVKEPEQVPETVEDTPEQAPENVEEQPEVTVQDLQAVGRRLAAAGKGDKVQAVLKAHNVRLISKIPEAERAAALRELEEAEKE